MTNRSPLTRRQALLSGTVGLGTLLAGCIDDDGNDGAGGNGTGGNGDENGAENNGETSFETKQLGPAVGTPVWARADRDRPGVVFLHESPGDIGFGSATVEVNFEDEQIEQFIGETDFETQRLLRVEAVGPNGCHDRIEFDGLAVEDGTVLGEATVTSPEDGEACDQAITYPRAFVRVDAPVDVAELEITDGWGETATVRSDEQPRFDPDELDGGVAPAGDPPAVPEPLACEGFERKLQWSDEDDILLGNEDDPTFALRVAETSYKYGDTALIRLTNTTMDWLITGNRHKYNLQLRTADGWQDVRATEDELFGYTDEGIMHPPGGGFEWELDLTEEGILADHIHGDRLEVCPDLRTGRYRFVYWPTDLAVEFDLTVE